MRQSGPGTAYHGRITKQGRGHARGMLVEAGSAAARAPGPLRSFFLRVQTRRRQHVAAVATARSTAALRPATQLLFEDHREYIAALASSLGSKMKITLSYCSLSACESVPSFFQANGSSKSSLARSGKCRSFLFADGLAKLGL